MVLAVCAFALVAYVAAIWFFGSRPTQPVKPRDLSAAPAAAAGPYGRANRRESATVHADSAPSGTPLDLDLVGVALGGRLGAAIIADRSGRQETYRVGDSVRDGAVLEQVSRDGAVLVVGEARQRLLLKKRTAASNQIVATTTRAGGSAVTARDSRPRSRGLFRWRGGNVRPEALMRGLFIPNPDGGFRLEQVKPGSAYAKAGFRAGDIVRSLNGQQIESAEQLVVLHQQLIEGGGGRGEIEVLREGRAETLRYGAS